MIKTHSHSGFPVMVFIHGGGYINGEAKSYGDIGICENVVCIISFICLELTFITVLSSDLIDESTFSIFFQVTRGIVFATIQYRLGYLGFLSTG